MKKLFSGIKWFEDTLTSAFLSIVVLITLANVVARYVMKSSIPWAQEISGFFWTWTVMIGMSVGYRRNLHYGVDFLVAKLPKKYAIVLKRIVYSNLRFYAVPQYQHYKSRFYKSQRLFWHPLFL